jgi:hypothetical protein
MLSIILQSMNYNIYRITFDVLLAKQDLQVDLHLILNIAMNTHGPYDNTDLVNQYIQLRY